MEVTIEPEVTREAEEDRRKASTPKDHIPGWGYDANPENDPTYPMKNRTGADHLRFNYQKPVQQPVNVEVLQSNERPGISRVFGTSVPPSGITANIRRYAFRYSESSYLHWVPLVVADRIDVARGIIDDLKRGHIPNIFAEFGWQAEWKYNRKKFVQRMIVRVAIAAAVVWLFTRKKKSLSFG